MSYNIDRAELINASATCTISSNNINEYLGRVKDSFQSLIDEENFDGKGAEAVKNYLKYVHISVIDAIGIALTEYYSVLALYTAGCSEYDTAEEATFNEDYFNEIAEKINIFLSDFNEFHFNADKTEGDVYDLIGDQKILPLWTYTQEFEEARERILKLRDDIGTYDADFDNAQIKNIKDLINKSNNLIDKIDEKGIFTAKQLSLTNYIDSDSYKDLYTSIYEASDFITSNQDEINESIEFTFDYVKRKQKEREKELRIKMIEQGVVLVGTAAIGIYSVVTTCGSSAPVVIKLIGACYKTVESATILVEGGEYIYCGIVGDFETQPGNFIRDDFFNGNTDAYMTVSLLASGGLIFTDSVDKIYMAGVDKTAKKAAKGLIATEGSVEAMNQIETAVGETGKVWLGLGVDYTGDKIAEACSDDIMVQFFLSTGLKHGINKGVENVTYSIGESVSNNYYDKYNNTNSEVYIMSYDGFYNEKSYEFEDINEKTLEQQYELDSDLFEDYKQSILENNINEYGINDYLKEYGYIPENDIKTESEISYSYYENIEYGKSQFDSESIFDKYYFEK